ncbi:MAG: hypothetical protein IKT08_09640 [Bacteroidales bacterium]|nr:hypothetical protein [Bacteroidales bacterium]
MDLVSLVVGLLTLIVAVAALIVSILTYRYARRSNKQHIKEQIACKKAKMEALDSMPYYGISFDVLQSFKIQKMQLGAEIEQLKMML